MKREIATTKAPLPGGPYSQGVKTGHHIFVSGQDGIYPNGDLAGKTIAEQTKACLNNVKHILAAAETPISNIVYVTCHLSDLNEENVQEFNQSYEDFFKDIEVKPARITVGSQLLDGKVEISAIALRY
ncbi:MAG TPA: Rid family hydrolase [Virgibacillus sp.]|nr:Rid family hydrolase [Virgibacillus sp.]HLR65602.1 Rid family hydrolase [Virgibacillus sp.]